MVGLPCHHPTQEHEIDLVVEASVRSALAIEVELSDTVTSADVVQLNWLASQLGDRLADRVVVYAGDSRRPQASFGKSPVK